MYKKKKDLDSFTLTYYFGDFLTTKKLANTISSSLLCLYFLNIRRIDRIESINPKLTFPKLKCLFKHSFILHFLNSL